MVSNAEHDAALARLKGMLDDPGTLDGLEQFVERLPELNATIELLSGFLANSSRIAENASGIVGTARKALGVTDAYEQTQSIKETVERGARIADELGGPLSEPETLQSMRTLVEMLPKLVAILQVFEQFLESSSRFAENVNTIVTTARRAAEDKWPDLLDRQGLLDLPQQVHSLINSPSLLRLLESRVLSDGALHVMDQVAAATVEAHQVAVEQDKRVSRLGAFNALGDPDVQRGLAFTLELAKSLGAHIREQPHATPTSSRDPDGASGAGADGA